jgi:hypothetical protein
MPFGTSLTSYIANLFPTDPVAPQVIGDFAEALPPSPIRGETISHYSDSVIPTDPVRPSDLGSQVSFYIQLTVLPDVSSDYLI